MATWVRAEEYEFTCSEEEIKIMFEVFARAEEVLRATPIPEYRKLLGVLDSHLGRTTSVASLHRESLRVQDAQDADLDFVKKFVSEHIDITEDLGDRLKGAEIYKAYQEAASEGDAVMKDKPFYRRLVVALADNHNGLRGRDVAYEGVRLSQKGISGGATYQRSCQENRCVSTAWPQRVCVPGPSCLHSHLRGAFGTTHQRVWVGSTLPQKL